MCREEKERHVVVSTQRWSLNVCVFCVKRHKEKKINKEEKERKKRKRKKARKKSEIESRDREEKGNTRETIK